MTKQQLAKNYQRVASAVASGMSKKDAALLLIILGAKYQNESSQAIKDAVHTACIHDFAHGAGKAARDAIVAGTATLQSLAKQLMRRGAVLSAALTSSAPAAATLQDLDDQAAVVVANAVKG